MKKQALPLLIVITLLFLMFTVGFFLGRNQNHNSIHLSEMPTEPQHHILIEESTEETQPDVSFPVDINTAGIRELTALPGIGEVLAQRILNFRSNHGSFSKPEELLNVEGIGAGKLEEILDYIVAGG